MSRSARRWGLRTRVTLLLAGGALVLSTLLALAAYETTRRNLVAERERTAVQAAFFDAAVVRQGLLGEETDIVAVLRSLDTGQQRRPILLREGQWYARNADAGLTAAVPTALLEVVAGGKPASQRIEVDGTAALVVGVPLPRVDADYFEVESLAQLDSTLTTLSGTLTAAALLTTAAGAALGIYASRRLLRPLGTVAEAARDIAAGDLSVRLDDAGDPDLRPLTRSFNTMADEVATRIERDRRFAADVSHELRSPLQTLSAASSVLEGRRDSLDPRSAAASTLVFEEVSRFIVLVSDLLELATDDETVDLRPVDVSALLADCSRRAGLDASVVSVQPGLDTWSVDRRRVERVLVNLLDNALKHGGGAVRVAAATEGDALVLEVDDAGPGVPIDERSLVFDRFGRGRSSSSRGGADGTGLGLSLVARHLESMHGHVEVGDRPGGGARFRVVLP